MFEVGLEGTLHLFQQFLLKVWFDRGNLIDLIVLIIIFDGTDIKQGYNFRIGLFLIKSMLPHHIFPPSLYSYNLFTFLFLLYLFPG